MKNADPDTPFPKLDERLFREFNRKIGDIIRGCFRRMLSLLFASLSVDFSLAEKIQFFRFVLNQKVNFHNT